MSNEIANLNQQVPAFLKNKAAKADLEAFTSGITAGMPLPMLSFRGKEFRLRKDGHEVNTRTRDLEVVFIAARPHVSKRYYAGQYVSGETTAPDCSSVDGITPDVADPYAAKCQECPNNAWGSLITASGKHGKACQDYKRIVVLPLFGGKPSKEPAVLDIPATSLKAPKGFRGKEFMFREYMAALAKHELPPQGIVTNLGFTDAEYPQLAFSFVRFVNEQEWNLIEDLKKAPEVQEVLQAAQVDPVGKIIEEPAPQADTQASEPVIGQDPAPHMDSAANEPEYPETLAALKAKKLPQLKALAEELGVNPKQKKPELVAAIAEELELNEEAAPQEPQQEAAPQEPQQEASGEDNDQDVMAELKSLLGG